MQATALFAKHSRQFRLYGHRRFFTQMAIGSLPISTLAVYLAQDNLYLAEFRKALLRLARQVPNPSRQTLMLHSGETFRLMGEQRRYIVGDLRKPKCLKERPRPTTYAYINHLKTSVARGLVSGLAAILPCYYLYREGVRILRLNGSRHPLLRRWIQTLPSAQSNAAWLHEIVWIFNAMSRAARKSEIEETFSLSMSYEVLFLDMVVEDQAWP
jgi:hydroxymethylpyrimidine/phosphomethylpyrimidine kinase